MILNPRKEQIRISKKILIQNSLYKNYKLAFGFRGFYFNLEKIVINFKWSFNDQKLSELNQMIGEGKQFHLKTLHKLIMDVMIIKNKNDYETRSNFFFWYLYAICSFAVRKNKKLKLILDNPYTTKSIDEVDYIKRNYYYDFLKGIQVLIGYNHMIKDIFKHMPFLLTRP
ncbi:hypothetical protein [Mycoplasmopsis columbinasalis]|uniref:Uncharacterized protein n=1 Tax=Mycoplasmopsis columbinasalis TaxID=114880 RepID=A0A449B9W8_9BACT|nr:hypothetical protein [Mycoplasmopsis columbinasalis]VEU77980.1 Uncharacterised protein [Mycoplasmopsis columbinasalis]